MSGLVETVAYGLVTAAVLFLLTFLTRRVLIPFGKHLIYDGPTFTGDWEATLSGENDVSFSLTLEISHYWPYVRGKLKIKKLQGGNTLSTSNQKVTGFICDGYLSLSGRTKLNDRRSICALMLEIGAQSDSMSGLYIFRPLNKNGMMDVPINFRRTPTGN